MNSMQFQLYNNLNDAGRSEEALNFLEQIVNENPNDSVAYAIMGEKQRSMNLYPPAAMSYQNAIDIIIGQRDPNTNDPAFFYSLLGVSICYLRIYEINNDDDTISNLLDDGYNKLILFLSPDFDISEVLYYEKYTEYINAFIDIAYKKGGEALAGSTGELIIKHLKTENRSDIEKEYLSLYVSTYLSTKSDTYENVFRDLRLQLPYDGEKLEVEDKNAFIRQYLDLKKDNVYNAIEFVKEKFKKYPSDYRVRYFFADGYFKLLDYEETKKWAEEAIALALKDNDKDKFFLIRSLEVLIRSVSSLRNKTYDQKLITDDDYARNNNEYAKYNEYLYRKLFSYQLPIWSDNYYSIYETLIDLYVSFHTTPIYFLEFGEGMRLFESYAKSFIALISGNNSIPQKYREQLVMMVFACISENFVVKVGYNNYDYINNRASLYLSKYYGIVMSYCASTPNNDDFCEKIIQKLMISFNVICKDGDIQPNYIYNYGNRYSDEMRQQGVLSVVMAKF